ncbi:MAG TPA: GNAT family N-acetyltransferase [Gemmatimonadaceae bacterium]|nr:GNAT family N-acetyltransferase [Gemmatimonadaceae bacterium]
MTSLSFTLVGPADAPALAELRSAAARDLTERFGHGHWSHEATERGVIADLRHAEVWAARRGKKILGTFRLATKKPWAIDKSYFTGCRRAIYLTNMAVHPEAQRQGIGRRCLEHAVERVRRWPAQAIRLDAYDAEAGAGPFYAKCGFREVGRVVYRNDPLIYYELVLD